MLLKNEKSFGIIPCRKKEGKWEVLLVQHQAGNYWAFPKGHADVKETPKQTACRELKEETGLEVIEFLQFPPLMETYRFQRAGASIDKEVTYWLATVKGEERLQLEEISSLGWFPLKEAEIMATFQQMKKLCRKVSRLLEE